MKQRVQSALPEFALDADSGRLLSAQILEFVRDAIVRGTLPPGSCLPSTRTLASKLGVSRNTVASAYEGLWLEGLVEGKSGSGTRVNPAWALMIRSAPPGIPTPQQILREAHYPVGVLHAEDPDGNPLRFQP